MSSPSSGFFGKTEYATPETRALSSIADAPEIGQHTDFQRLIQQHDASIKFLATNQQKLQQGVNDATQNPVQQLQQFISDLVVLFGGGELAQGLLDFGDLKYLLPALGALFGFGSGPYPVNLLQAAEKFFLGYIVPSEQYADLLTHFIDTWAGFAGIDPKFVKDVDALVTAVADLFDGVHNLLPSMQSLLSALGLGSGRDLGPLGQSLNSVLHLFNGVDTSLYTDITHFVTGVMDTFVVNLTAVINWIDEVLRIFEAGGDVVNSPLGDITAPFVTLFGQVQYLAVTGLYDVEQGFDNLGSSLLKYLTPSGGGLGQFDSSALVGALNPAVTFLVSSSNVALSTLLGNLTATGAFVASALTGALNPAVTFLVGASNIALSTLLQNLSATGTLVGSAVTGALNGAVTLGGNAVSTLFNGSGLIASQIAGALNPAVTFLVGASNIALSTLLQNLSTTGTFVASALTGAINPAVTFLVGASNIALSTLLQNLSATGTLVASALTGAINTAVTLQGTALSSLFSASAKFIGSLDTTALFSGTALSTVLTNITASTGALNAAGLTGAINTAVTYSGTALSTLLQYLNSSGQFNAAQITGAINTAVTFSGTALSSLLQYLNSSGQFNAAQLTGAINTAVTYAGTALSTVLTNITASTGALNAAGLAGALNIAVTLRGVALSSLFNSSANFIGVIDAAATGALNSALTYSGTALSTVLTNITASTGALNAAGLSGALATAVTISGNAVSTLFNSSGVLASKLTGAINPAVTFLVGASNIALSTLLQNLNATGQLAGSALTGAINLAATIGGVALSTIFSGTGTFIGQLDAAATGALNSAITFAGTALSTVLTNITPSTGAIAGGGVTGLLATGNDIVTDVTNAVDNLVNVFTGGSGSGNTPAALPVAAAAIPHANIVPPANPGSTVSHDASANATPVTGTTNTLSITPYSHVVAVGGYLTVKVATLSSYVGALPAVVTFGGTPVPLLTPPSFAFYVVSGVFKIVTTAIYGMAVPAGATANVAVTAAAAGAAKVYALQVESDSYLGVGSVGGAVAAGGGSNASFASGNIASTSGSWVVSSAAVIAESSETLSAYNKTSRYNPGSTFNSTAAAYLAMITGDATSSGSLIQFTATASYTTKNVWVSSAVNLIPSPVTILGSGFRQYRVSTTGVTLSNTGLTTPSLLPNSFFDTNDNVTSDLTSAPATANKLTFSNAAWYAVTICLYQPSGSASDVDLACALFKNGTAIRVGGFVDTKFVNSAQATFQVYLVAGDYLQPGYSCTAATPVIKGEATGIMCYWEVALMNRGILS